MNKKTHSHSHSHWQGRCCFSAQLPRWYQHFIWFCKFMREIYMANINSYDLHCNCSCCCLRWWICFRTRFSLPNSMNILFNKHSCFTNKKQQKNKKTGKNRDDGNGNDCVHISHVHCACIWCTFWHADWNAHMKCSPHFKCKTISENN